jgi:hypothetical protein
VTVVQENPRGDEPPLAPVELAKIYYAPNPTASPWKEKWGISVAPYEASAPEIEFFIAHVTALDRLAGKIRDLDKLDATARREALATVRAKYRLPPHWASREFYGAGGEVDRSAIVISGDVPSESFAALSKCLDQPRPSPVRMWGCAPDR